MFFVREIEGWGLYGVLILVGSFLVVKVEREIYWVLWYLFFGNKKLK